MEENEDAYRPLLNNGEYFSGSFFQCAVADGATLSSFSKEFATSLVKSSVACQMGHTFLDVIKQARVEWNDSIGKLELTWPATEKVKEGAYSTLLWLRFYPQGTGNFVWKNLWKAHAIGDSCFFQFRKDRLIQAGPISNSQDFHNRPALIGSKNGYLVSMEEWDFSGSWEKGDDFFLGTDAISKWMMQQCEKGKNPGVIVKDRLARKSEPGYFEHWIQGLRKRKEIRDDDTTIVWIKII